MNIKGYAFQPNEAELAKSNAARYAEIKHLAADIEMSKSPQYARTKFSGTLKTEAAQSLSEFDIALIADHGNLCFGGNCTKSGNAFHGEYCTD